MKQKILSLTVALCCIGYSHAQLNQPVATLTHNNSTSAYYGPEALIQACEQAEHGDIINLSSGTFDSPTITKAITIRGAGIEGENMTSLRGTSYFAIPRGVTTQGVRLEGLYMAPGFVFDIKGYFDNTLIMKCKLSQLYISADTTSMENLQVINSIFLGMSEPTTPSKIRLWDFNNRWSDCNNCISFFSASNISPVSASFINCFLQVPTGCVKFPQVAQCINCIVGISQCSDYRLNQYDCTINTSDYTSYNNCILFNTFEVLKLLNNTSGDHSEYYPHMHLYTRLSGAATRNSILLSYIEWNEPASGETQVTGQNCIFSTYDKVFKTFTGLYQSGEDFALTDSIATAFPGSDGSQVGMYGGFVPFSKELSYPQITKLDVQKRVENDILNIDIEVHSPINAQENE